MEIGIVGRCLTELGCSLLIDSVFYKFTDSPKAAPFIIGSTLAQTACNTSLRCNIHKIPIARDLCSNIFACLTGTHMQRLLHEAGHAWASTRVFKNAQPKITLFPFGEGTTKYATDELTDFGQKLGKRRSLCFITIAGPAASLLVSTIAMIVGVVVQVSFLEIGSYLIAYGRMDFFAHAVYALSAMCSPSSQIHDFVILKDNGIHPLSAAIGLLAIPFLIVRS